MKKKTIILILLAITTPQIASAIWWNPTTWFQETNQVFEPQKIKEVTDKPTETVKEKAVEKPIIKEVVKEVPVEKVVEKIVSDPKLLEEIKALKAKIVTLEARQCTPALGGTSDTRKKQIDIEIAQLDTMIINLGKQYCSGLVITADQVFTCTPKSNENGNTGQQSIDTIIKDIYKYKAQKDLFVAEKNGL